MKLAPSLIPLAVLLVLSLHQRHRVTADGTCSENCRPYNGEIHCNKTTGECSEGCNTGYFGPKCDRICQCGGRACTLTDGTCISVKPVPVSPGHETQDCQTTVYVVVICVLAVSLAVITGFVIWKYKAKRCYQRRRRSTRQRSEQPEGQPMVAGSDQPRPPLPQSEKEQLARDLGVHILYPHNKPDDPVFLFCIHMKYDFRRVNSATTHITRERFLVNEPDKESAVDTFTERFKTFDGTTSLSPTFHGDSPTYWEVHCNVHLKDQLGPTDLLLCIGLCREMDRNKDEWFQTPLGPNCYNLNVGLCYEHKKICSKIYRENIPDPIKDVETDIKNETDKSGDLRYGVLVHKGENVIVYFDLVKMERIGCLENVDFARPLWPMFGVFRRSCPRVRMKLVTGRDIDMSQNKKDMIANALPSE